MHEERIVISGQKLTLIWAVTKNGDSPARNFFDQLPIAEKARLLVLFKRLADVGKIFNREQFKKLEPNLWQFKRFQLRFLGDFRPKHKFVIALGLKKKKSRHSPKDLQKAKHILQQHDQGPGR